MCPDGRRRPVTMIIVLAMVVVVHRPAFAQQPTGTGTGTGTTDVGGNPAKRKVTKMPVVVKFVEAEYPPSKKAAGIAASVLLTIEINATGKVTNVSIAGTSGSIDFDDAASRAAMSFEFEPAEVDNKPAPSKITYRYDFVIKEEPAPPPTIKPVTPAIDVDAKAAGTDAPVKAPDDIQEVEVRGTPRSRRETVDYSVRAEQANKVAGTQGDVLKVVQNLPGVSRPPVASGQIVVWGSAPKDTRVYVDGVDLPALYHGGGLRGTINSDLISTIDLVPGAFGAEYGRGLGGLVRVETRALPRGTHGYVGADTLDASAFTSTEVHERVRVGAAFRYGWLDRVLPAVSDKDIGDYFPIPRYRDAQIKATIDLRKRESVDTVFLISADALARTVASADPARRRVEATSSSFWRAYARYTSVSERGDTTIVTPFVGRDSNRLAQRFGSTPTVLDVDNDRYGVRASVRSPIVPKRLTVTSGVDAFGTFSNLRREGSLTLPPREGDVYVFGQPPGDEYAFDTWKTHVLDVGPHVYADVKLGPVTVTPGVRLDAFLIEGNKRTPGSPAVPPIGFSRMDTAVAPRASVRWDVTSRFALTTAFGNYHQPPEPEELSSVFGTPELGLAKSRHVTVGESLRLTDALTLDVVAFDKRMSDLTVRSRRTNPLKGILLTQNGEGHSYGVQFLLRQEIWKGFFGWASYAISKSERRYDDPGEASWRAFDFDQPHVLSIVASQEIGRWGVGARFRYASGNPRTPVVGSVYDARYDRFDPVFGPQNTTRIPSFWQLDLRVDRSFALGSTLKALLFVDLQNIVNRENAEEITYAPDFKKQGVITGLPFIAVVGGRVEL